MQSRASRFNQYLYGVRELTTKWGFLMADKTKFSMCLEE